jgi:hypothetical protein
MALIDEHAMDPNAGGRGLNVACLAGAAVALGLAINVRDGEYWPRALQLLSIALFLSAAGTLARGTGLPASWARIAPAVVGAMLVLQFLVFITSPPSGWNPWSDDLRDVTATERGLYGLSGVAALLLIGVAAVRGDRSAAWCAPVLLVLHFTVGLWLIRAAPSPQIDVYVFQQGAAGTLLEGRNPYAMTFRDIYNSTEPGTRPVYGRELVREDGQLAFGFPYPPLSLYLSTAGYAVTGDHRYAQLLAMTLTGALLAYARPGLWATAMAALLLFTPRGFFVLGRGWTEPFVVLFVAATVFCACRCRKLLPISLGLLLASKQYLVLAVPLTSLLLEGPFRWRAYLGLLLKAGGVAALVTLPLALWDWSAFWQALVTVQNVAPFREDALSYLVWIHHQTGIQLGVAPAFIAAGVAAALVLWRAERSPAGFASAVALVYLVFIALNKQAFANYYYFVLGALSCALAVMPVTHANGDPRAAGSLQRPGTPAADEAR